MNTENLFPEFMKYWQGPPSVAPSRGSGEPRYQEEFILLISDWYSRESSDWMVDYLLTAKK